MIDSINCPHCRGKIELKSSKNELVKIPKDMIEGLKNETLGSIEIDENLQIKPVYMVKDPVIIYDDPPKPKKNIAEIIADELMS